VPAAKAVFTADCVPPERLTRSYSTAPAAVAWTVMVTRVTLMVFVAEPVRIATSVGVAAGVFVPSEAK
jgi:hypothetical protein